MSRSLKYILLMNVLPNLAVVAAFSAVIGAGWVMTGGSEGDGFFHTYFESFPVMLVMILFLLAFSLSTSNLNLALSFGDRRKDYFWAMQGGILTYSVGAWIIQTAMTALPGLLGQQGSGMLLEIRGMASLGYLLVCTAVLAAGCVCGQFYIRSRVWGAIVMVSFVILGIVFVVMFLFTVNDWGIGIWGDLPAILTVVMAAVLAVCELTLYRSVRKAVVK